MTISNDQKAAGIEAILDALKEAAGHVPVTYREGQEAVPRYHINGYPPTITVGNAVLNADTLYDCIRKAEMRGFCRKMEARANLGVMLAAAHKEIDFLKSAQAGNGFEMMMEMRESISQLRQALDETERSHAETSSRLEEEREINHSHMMARIDGDDDVLTGLDRVHRERSRYLHNRVEELQAELTNHIVQGADAFLLGMQFSLKGGF